MVEFVWMLLQNPTQLYEVFRTEESAMRRAQGIADEVGARDRRDQPTRVSMELRIHEWGIAHPKEESKFGKPWFEMKVSINPFVLQP